MNMKTLAGLLVVVCIAGNLRAESEEEQAFSERLRKEREAAERRNTELNNMTPEQKAAWRAKEQARKDKEAKQVALADYKEKTLASLDSVRRMFAEAEKALKEQRYRAAGAFYQSISMATVSGSETEVASARERLIELEDVAKKMLSDAEEADLKHEYVTEVDLLSTIVREFPSTKTKDAATRKLIALKSRPDVAAYADLAQAEALENDGKLLEARDAYQAIGSNPRYENSLPALKARKHLEKLTKDPEQMAKLSAEVDSKADREVPVLLAAAKNYITNHRPKLAAEKLQQIVDRFPQSKYAQDAKKQLDELKDIK